MRAAALTGVVLVAIAAGCGGTKTVTVTQTSTTVQTVTILNPQQQRADFGHGIYALPYPNATPVFDSTAVTGATAGQPYLYQAHATDPDGVVITYLLVRGPDEPVLIFPL